MTLNRDITSKNITSNNILNNNTKSTDLNLPVNLSVNNVNLITKPLKNEHDEWRDSVKTFWSKNKAECCLIRSIDEVYKKYVIYHEKNAEKNDYIHKPMNKYIFRTYIRKHGYNNGNADKFDTNEYITLT